MHLQMLRNLKKDMDLLLKKIVDSKPADGFERVVYAGLMESEEFAKELKKESLIIRKLLNGLKITVVK